MAYAPLEQSIDPIASAVMGRSGARRCHAPRALDPGHRTETVPGGFVTRVVTIEQQLEASLVRERLLSLLAAFFGRSP